MRWMLTLLLLVCWSGLFAQRDSITSLGFGVGLGYFASQVDLRNTLRAENEIVAVEGFQYSLGMRYFNTRAAGFVVELSYTQAGWAENASDTLAEYRYEADYLEAQMLTQLAVGRGIIRPLLQAGPYLAVPLSQRQIVPPGFPVPEDTYYGQPLPTRINYGLTVGAGLYFRLGPVALQLDGRYVAGLSDLIQSGSFGVSTSRRQAIGGRATVWYELRN